MTIDETSRTDLDEAVRGRAIARLKKRRDFHAHLLVYLLFTAAISGVWFAADADGFFWPIFIIAFWGIGVVMNGWEVYHADPFSEEQIQREIRKLSV